MSKIKESFNSTTICKGLWNVLNTYNETFSFIIEVKIPITLFPYKHMFLNKALHSKSNLKFFPYLSL